MSSWGPITSKPTSTADGDEQRVREQVRGALALVGTSLLASSLCALAITLVTKLAG